MLKKNNIDIDIIIMVAHLAAISKSLNIARNIGLASKMHIKYEGVSVKYSLEINVENLQNIIITVKKVNITIVIFNSLEIAFGNIFSIFSVNVKVGRKLYIFRKINININPIKKLIINENITDVFTSLIK